jgi:hypothetical protein
VVRGSDGVRDDARRQLRRLGSAGHGDRISPDHAHHRFCVDGARRPLDCTFRDGPAFATTTVVANAPSIAPEPVTAAPRFTR